MARFQALDLFCGAGGTTRGLQRAGFHVVGIDFAAQPRYCGDDFVRMDVMDLNPSYLRGFDFVWASPPCQGYSAMRHAPGAKGAPRLINQIRWLLIAAGVPWCIENVETAAWAMQNPIMLCGSMFGLGAQGCQTQRHRLFACSFHLRAPGCRHDARPVIGVYGGHARKRSATAGGRGTRDIWQGGHRAAASEALGIDWMTLAEMSESIPPVYAEFVARAWLQTKKAAARPMSIPTPKLETRRGLK